MKAITLSICALFVVAMFAACGPSVTTEPEPNSLDVSDSGSVNVNGRVYDFRLHCGCTFPMKIIFADTTHISYATGQIPDTISFHKVIATAKLPLPPSGTYIDSLVIETAPPTVESFRYTLRDTLIVP